MAPVLQLLPSVGRESWLVVVTTLALVLYGVLQERVMTRGWGQDQELFPYSSFLVLSNRLLTVLVLIGHSAFCGHTFIPVAPLRSYCLVSGSNMVSTLCQYEALKYVSFVTQTLAKTAKALPVVLWGTLFGGKRYSARQYAHAVLITGGCSIFVLGGDITSGSAIKDASWGSYAAGSLLLLTYLAADGWTSTQQEVLFKTHATPVREQLLYTTAFSTAYSLAASLASGQLLPALAFLQRHPDAAAAVVTLSLASTVIQVCISSVLQRHGALMFALMMTSRQCVSVLLSTLLFGHTLSAMQWLGVAVAFSALYHQKTSGSSSSSRERDRLARQPSMRSRLAISSGPHKLPHARESDPSHPPPDSHALSLSQGGAATAVPGQQSRFRGSQAGIHSSSNSSSILIPAGGQGPVVAGGLFGDAAAAAAAAATVAGAAAGAVTRAGRASQSGGVSSAAAAAAAAPSPALMGPWRAASMYTGGAAAAAAAGHDPYLVAVAEVQPMVVAPPLGPMGVGVIGAGGIGQQHVMQRHATPRDPGLAHMGGGYPGSCHHHQHPAGMALCFPPMKPAAAPRAANASPAALGSHTAAAAAAAAAAAGGAASIRIAAAEPPPPPGVPALKALDLRTLWSRGLGV